jgi:hypothetical protein
MPKPFGTKALLEAEEKARRTAAQKQLEANKKANAVSKSTLHRVGINRLGFILSAISLDFLNEVNVS